MQSSVQSRRRADGQTDGERDASGNNLSEDLEDHAAPRGWRPTGEDPSDVLDVWDVFDSVAGDHDGLPDYLVFGSYWLKQDDTIVWRSEGGGASQRPRRCVPHRSLLR